jgi:hypothetical protein
MHQLLQNNNYTQISQSSCIVKQWNTTEREESALKRDLARLAAAAAADAADGGSCAEPADGTAMSERAVMRCALGKQVDLRYETIQIHKRLCGEISCKLSMRTLTLHVHIHTRTRAPTYGHTYLHSIVISHRFSTLYNCQLPLLCYRSSVTVSQRFISITTVATVTYTCIYTHIRTHVLTYRRLFVHNSAL